MITELLKAEGRDEERKLLNRLKELEQFSEPKYYGVLSTLDDLKTNPFDFILPRSFRKYFYQDTFPYFKPRQYVRLGFAGLLVIIPFVFVPPKLCEEPTRFNGNTYCLKTSEDSAKFRNGY